MRIYALLHTYILLLNNKIIFRKVTQFNTPLIMTNDNIYRHLCL